MGAVPELVYRYPQIAMHLPQKAVSPFVQNYILKRPAGPGIAVLGTCWPRRLHRDLRLGQTIQGSHPSLDLVSTSEVITALSRNKNRQVSQKYCKEWLHNTSFSHRTGSYSPIHGSCAWDQSRRRRPKSRVRTISKVVSMKHRTPPKTS